MSPLLRLREACSLYRINTADIESTVAAAIRRLQQLEKTISDRFSFDLINRDILEIGAGQLLLQMRYFANKNRVFGIDSDVIVDRGALSDWWRMWAANGSVRTLKTLTRKCLGVDRRYRREFERQLSSASDKKLKVLQMNVQAMTFADASFDFVHCLSVFHHLPEPQKAIREIVRCLRPGGLVFISFHLFSSETGSLDPRVFTKEFEQIKGWPHLRPELCHGVNSNAYLNRIRLHEWRVMFDSAMPGCHFTVCQNARPGVAIEADALLQEGKIVGYSVEELAAHNIVILWQKPSD